MRQPSAAATQAVKNRFIKQSEDEARISCQVSINWKTIKMQGYSLPKGSYSVQIFRGPMKSEAKPVAFPKDVKKLVKIPINLTYEFATTLFRLTGREHYQPKSATVKLLKAEGSRSICISEASFDLAE